MVYKVTTVLGLVFSSLYAMATSPLYLTFRATDGSERSFQVSALSMTVSDGKLHIRNDEVQAELYLSSLSSMRFTHEDASDAIVNINASPDTSVTVYSIKGESLGTFKSVEQAEKSLPSGTYLFKIADKAVKKIIK